MMVIVMVIVMRLVSSWPRSWRSHLGFWKCIRRKGNRSRWSRRKTRSHLRYRFVDVRDRNTAHATELCARTIQMAANLAGTSVVIRKFLSDVMGRIFRVGLGSQALRRFESRSHLVGTRLWAAHLGLQSTIQFLHIGTADGTIQRLRERARSLVFFVHQSNHLLWEF